MHRFDVLIFVIFPRVRLFFDFLRECAVNGEERTEVDRFCAQSAMVVPQWCWELGERYRDQFLSHLKPVISVFEGSVSDEGYRLAALKKHFEESGVDPDWYPQIRERIFKSSKGEDSLIYRYFPNNLDTAISLLNEGIASLVSRDSKESLNALEGMAGAFKLPVDALRRPLCEERHRPVWETMIVFYPAIEELRKSGEGSVAILHDFLCEVVPDYLDVSENNTQKLCRSIGLSFRSRGRPKKKGNGMGA